MKRRPWNCLQVGLQLFNLAIPLRVTYIRHSQGNC